MPSWTRYQNFNSNTGTTETKTYRTHKHCLRGLNLTEWRFGNVSQDITVKILYQSTGALKLDPIGHSGSVDCLAVLPNG